MLLEDVCRFLNEFAPPRLAEDWDNVGLLVGDATRPVSKIMTCLTITPGSAAEAVSEHADLIVTHHPLPFRPLKRLTTETVPGRLLLQLIEASIAIHSPHTAFDSAAAGINQRLAVGIGLAGLLSRARAGSAIFHSLPKAMVGVGLVAFFLFVNPAVAWIGFAVFLIGAATWKLVVVAQFPMATPNNWLAPKHATEDRREHISDVREAWADPENSDSEKPATKKAVTDHSTTESTPLSQTGNSDVSILGSPSNENPRRSILLPSSLIAGGSN